MSGNNNNNGGGNDNIGNFYSNLFNIPQGGGGAGTNVAEYAGDIADNTPEEPERPQITREEIIEHANKFVVGQTEAKNTLAHILYNHIWRRHYNVNVAAKSPESGLYRLSKSNVLLIGNSGVGKTYLIKTMCKYLDIPYVIEDVTKFSSAGYTGDNVESMLTALYMESQGNLHRAEGGVIFIDEMDKMATRKTNTGSVNTTGVQHALLKMVEGQRALRIGKSFHRDAPQIPFDTSDVLFVFAGAFGNLSGKIEEEMAEYGERRTGKNKSVGFIRPAKKNVDEAIAPELASLVEEQDIIDYGIIPEILGRIGTYVVLNKLTHDDLINILVKAENNPVQQFKRLFQYQHREWPLTRPDYDLIVNKCMKSETGARGLLRELEKMLVVRENSI